MWFQFFHMCHPRASPRIEKSPYFEYHFHIVGKPRSVQQLSVLCFKCTACSLTQRRAQFSTHLVFNRTTVLHCGISDPVCDDSTGWTDKHRSCVWLEGLLATPAGKGGKGSRRGHSVWRYDVACGQKLQYLLAILSIFSYVKHVGKIDI